MKPLLRKMITENKILRQITVTLLFFSMSLLLCGQTPVSTSDQACRTRFTEELIIKTDRDIYIAGEKVLMKIYKLKAVTRTPGNVSRIVYSELIDRAGTPVVQVKTEINGVSGNAEFTIPDTLSTGNYLIRTCTRWMQNFPADFYSYKRISVINPFEGIDRIKVTEPGQLPDSVVFFPEGGSLVAGLESTVGFRCYAANGMSVPATGYIVDSNADTLCRVESGANGTGFFSLRPENTGQLFFIADNRKRQEKRFSMPVVHNDGVVLSVKSSRKSFSVYIQTTGDAVAGRGKLFLCYQPLMTDATVTEVKDNEILLQREALPEGLARITLTDAGGSVMAERWVFNEKAKEITYTVRINDTVFGPRQKVQLLITATDETGAPVESDLMVSAVRSFSVDDSNSSNIKGYPQMPLFAAAGADAEDGGINDNLIFYRGSVGLCRAVNGEASDRVLHLPELGGQLICGTVTDPNTGEALAKRTIVISFVGRTAECSFATTDDHGRFSCVVHGNGSREMVIQPLVKGDEGFYTELDNPFPGERCSYTVLPFSPDSSRLDEINSAIISMQVRNIYDPYRRIQSVVQGRKAVHDFYGEPVDTVLMSNFIDLASVKEIVKEIVPGVSVVRKDGKSTFRIYDDISHIAFETSPMVLVDGVPVADIEKVLSMNPKEIERIEVLKARYIVSDVVIEGIVHFITKKGNLGAVELDRAVFRQEYNSPGASGRYLFPDYSVDTLRSSRIPDFRNTLYWEPDGVTDRSGNKSVEFYTSDASGEYYIIVEGISSEGSVGRSVISFRVGDRK